MKSFCRLCLLACMAFFSVACSDSVKLTGNEFLIEGKISGVEDGVVITLSRMQDDVGISIASDTVRDGCFTFKEEALSNPERMMMIARGDGFPSMYLNIWVAQGAKIKVKGEGKSFPAWEVKSSIPSQKEANQYANKSRNIIRRIAEIRTEATDLRIKVMTDYTAAESLEDKKNIELAYRKSVDSLEVIEDSLDIMRVFADIGIMEKTNISPIWLDKMKGISITLKYSDTNAENADNIRRKAEELYNRMSEEDKTTPTGYQITANLFPPIVAEVGDIMIDGSFLDINGNTKSLSDYSGKYILLDFWSRGCGPCIMALPEMKEVSETYCDNLTIISISLDADVVWKEALSSHDMPWVNIRDPKGYGGLAANYGVNAIPNYVIISPEGKIIDKWEGFGKGLIKIKVSENIKK